MFYFYFKRFIAGLEMNKLVVGVFKVPLLLAEFMKVFSFSSNVMVVDIL